MYTLSAPLSAAEAHPTSWEGRQWFGVPHAVKQRSARPWTSNEVLYNVLLLVVAFMIIVTAIYLPWINNDNCSSWCCHTGARTVSTASRESTAYNRLPFEPRESKATLTQFTRERNGAESGSSNAVMVLENMFTGLATLSIPHNPIYTIAKLAAQAQSSDNDATFVFAYKNHFPMVTVSGKRGSAEEIYMMVYLSQTLARERASLVLNGLTDNASAAFEALNNLVKDDVLEWHPTDLYRNGEETWISARFKAVNTSKSVSEYMYDIMYRYLELSGSSVRYYIISKEREEELRRAYKNDQMFSVTSVTSAFHGVVLKVLFPQLTLELVEPVSASVSLSPSTDPPTEEVYRKALDFIRDFIL